MSWIYGMPARLRLLFGARDAESRMDEEMRFHVEMETERLVREEGLTAAEARRRAKVAFGGEDRYREEMREGRGLAWLSGLSLDLKLGVRMLLKYPGLTAAGTLAIAVSVALAASYFEFMNDMVKPKLPLDEGDRIVAIQNWDLAAASPERRSLHDFEAWRGELVSIADLSAASMAEFNVSTDDRRYASYRGARVSASTFRVVRVAPLLGRPLTEADEAPDAPLAVVLGYSAWQALFDGDRAVVGRSVRLGADPATVVGVMPEGFRFPVNQEVWAPLRYQASDWERRDGPTIVMFGRLAPRIGLAEARAELATLGQRSAAAFPATHAQLRPRVERFTDVVGMGLFVALLNVPFVLFLVVVCGNVATLVFARTVSREGEIAVRSALGASRRRLVAQLFAEALVLTSLGAAAGLAAARWGLRWGMTMFWEVQQMSAPFWFDDRLSPITLLYTGSLAVIGAGIIGGVPALKATGRRLRHRLAQPGSGGAGMRFGAVSTGVVVVQVALCVAFLPLAITSGRDLLREKRGSDFPAEAFLTGRISRQTEALPGAGTGSTETEVAEHAAAQLAEVQRRISAESGVLAVTFANRMPGFNHPVEAIELEGDARSPDEVRVVAVDQHFFDVMGARIVAGRAFRDQDLHADSRLAVVDRSWAREHFAGRSPVGQRIRHPQRPAGEAERWHEIVGVVDGMPRAVGPGEDVAVFQPLRPGPQAAVQLYVRTATAPAALVPHVHDIVTAIDPALGVSQLMSLDDAWRPVYRANVFFATALTVVAAIIMLFALVGIVALMSFTVARRAREIGIRTALGADSRRLVVAIFSRALAQIGLGVIVGAALVSLAVARTSVTAGLVAGVAALMAGCGLVGCIVPALRALRIQPTDALRAE
ncbi:MAG TPA: ABC transporter permease [Longimicrobiales bacterium]|nr:ABC transporter permease [Longimicrobiales bacterium]